MTRSRLSVHPGEILRHEFLKPAELSASRLAKELGIPTNRLTEVIAGRRSITADTAIRLARYWGTSADFWMNLQANFDVVQAEAKNDYSRIRRRAA